jgi:hypothetical protein
VDAHADFPFGESGRTARISLTERTESNERDSEKRRTWLRPFDYIAAQMEDRTSPDLPPLPPPEKRIFNGFQASEKDDKSTLAEK